MMRCPAAPCQAAPVWHHSAASWLESEQSRNAMEKPFPGIIVQSSTRVSLARPTSSVNSPPDLSPAMPWPARLLQTRTKPAQSRASDSRGQTENVGPQSGPAPVQRFGRKPLAFLGFSTLLPTAENVGSGRVGGGRGTGIQPSPLERGSAQPDNVSDQQLAAEIGVRGLPATPAVVANKEANEALRRAIERVSAVQIIRFQGGAGRVRTAV